MPQPETPKPPTNDEGPTPEALRAAGVVETGAHGSEVLKEQLWGWRWRGAGVVALLLLVKGISSCIDFSRKESEKKGQAIATGLNAGAVEAAQAQRYAVQAQANTPPPPPPPSYPPASSGLTAALTAADEAASGGDAVAFTKKCKVVAKALKNQMPSEASALQRATFADLAFELTALCDAGFDSVPLDPWRSLAERIRRAQADGAVRE